MSASEKLFEQNSQSIFLNDLGLFLANDIIA